jgi:hypothetical protein
MHRISSTRVRCKYHFAVERIFLKAFHDDRTDGGTTDASEAQMNRFGPAEDPDRGAGRFRTGDRRRGGGAIAACVVAKKHSNPDLTFARLSPED